MLRPVEDDTAAFPEKAPRLQKAAAELAASGAKVKIFAKDLFDENAPEEIFSELQRENIPVFILLNNAGFGR